MLAGADEWDMLNMHYAVIPRNLRTCGSRYSVLVRIEIRSRGIPADIVRHRCGNFAQAVNIVYVDVQRIRGRVFRGNRTVFRPVHPLGARLYNSQPYFYRESITLLDEPTNGLLAAC